MKINSGGQTESLKGVIESIRIHYSDNRTFELWINDDSVSYLSINELLDLKNEIDEALQKCIK